MSANELEVQATKQHLVKMNRALINADEGDSDVEDDDSKQYIYMELESTAYGGGLVGMDVDAVFNSQTVDDFMHALSKKRSF